MCAPAVVSYERVGGLTKADRAKIGGGCRDLGSGCRSFTGPAPAPASGAATGPEARRVLARSVLGRRRAAQFAVSFDGTIRCSPSTSSSSDRHFSRWFRSGRAGRSCRGPAAQSADSRNITDRRSTALSDRSRGDGATSLPTASLCSGWCRSSRVRGLTRRRGGSAYLLAKARGA